MPLKQMVKRSDVEVAKAKRTCRKTKEAIRKGEPCLVVYDGPRDKAVYSTTVAHQMIALARKRLDEIEQQLRDPATTPRAGDLFQE